MIGAAQDGLAAREHAPDPARVVEGEIGFVADSDDARPIGDMEQFGNIYEQHAWDALLGDPLVKEVNGFGGIEAQRAVHWNFDDEMLQLHSSMVDGLRP